MLWCTVANRYDMRNILYLIDYLYCIISLEHVIEKKLKMPIIFSLIPVTLKNKTPIPTPEWELAHITVLLTI